MSTGFKEDQMPKVDKDGNVVTTVRLKKETLSLFKQLAFDADMSARQFMENVLNKAAARMRDVEERRLKKKSAMKPN
jgi:hypothetical protein